MSNINHYIVNTQIDNMIRYAKTFLLWLRTDVAKELPGDLTVKFSDYWVKSGLPIGWDGLSGEHEAATRNFLLQDGGDRIAEWGKLLDKGHETGEYSDLDDAIAQAVREYLDKLGVKDEAQDEDAAKLPEEAVGHITDRFTAVQ